MGVDVLESDSSSVEQVANWFRRANGSKNCWQIGFKFIELILCIGCIFLIDDPAQNSRIRVFVTQHTIAICYATFGSYLIYCVIFLIGKLLNDNWPWKSTSIWAFLASILLTFCTIILHKDWSDAKERNFWPQNLDRMNLVIGTAILSGINAGVHLIDAILIIAIGRR